MKALLRAGWKVAQGALVAASPAWVAGGRSPRVFYGGARPGHVGGPLVKVQRLQQYFPEHRFGFNVAYLLSNAPYLPAAALRRLKARRIPIVLNQNGVFFPGWFAGDWRAMNTEMRHAYERADHVFWQSAFCRRAAERFLGAPGGGGEVLFNAVDTRVFVPAAVAPAARPFTFLVTGKIDGGGAYRLAAAVQGLRAAVDGGLDAVLDVAGHVAESARDEAAAVVRRSGLADRVRFQGPYAQHEAPSIYQRADAYVMLKYLDSCPNTVLEAMACGLPVLHSASGGVPELVGGEAGVGLPLDEDWESPALVPPAEDIGAAMLRIARGATAMRQAARERAERLFDIRHWIDRHQQVFHQLLEARP